MLGEGAIMPTFCFLEHSAVSGPASPEHIRGAYVPLNPFPVSVSGLADAATAATEGVTSVVVIHSDARIEGMVVQACRSADVPVIAIVNIGELERWPLGQIVVVDLARISAFWRTIGVAHLVAIVSSQREGATALRRGATQWALMQTCAVSVVTLAGRASVADHV